MKRSFLTHLLLAACLLWLTACQSQPEEHQETLLVFGTLVTVTIIDDDKERITQAMQMVRNDLEYMHFAWHAWKLGSLGRVNQLLETTAEFSANPSVLELFNRAKTLSIQSDGLFNPAIGRLMHLWGFQSDELPTAPPAEEDIQALLKQAPSMKDIEVRAVRMQSHNAAVKLDFGAVAKGFALDKLLERLKSMGINNALINAGGDLKAIGRHDQRDWHIGVRDPNGKDVLASLEISNGEAVFTSGDYERYFEYQGKRFHHIIDPRSGYPADQTRSITILHHDGATADAAATALFIAGPAGWKRIARAMKIENVMLVDKHNHVYLTPGMQKRIKLYKDYPVTVETP